MARTKAEISVADLERILDERKSLVQELGKRREALHQELAEIQEQLQSIGGEVVSGSSSSSSSRGTVKRGPGRPPGKGSGKRGRPRGSKNRGPRIKNERSLREVISEVLSKSKKGYTLDELVPKVVEAGYKTNSANFKNMIYQNIYNSEGINKDPETGAFSLATP
jgi:hypothetical protein